jgi:hypothetical protein
MPDKDLALATTAYILGRSHTCPKCEHSNIPCGVNRSPETPWKPTSLCRSYEERINENGHAEMRPVAPPENPPEPKGPSVEQLREELILRNQEIEDLRLTNRNLSRKLAESVRALNLLLTR